MDQKKLDLLGKREKSPTASTTSLSTGAPAKSPNSKLAYSSAMKLDGTSKSLAQLPITKPAQPPSPPSFAH
jgi:hypothetical protein